MKNTALLLMASTFLISCSSARSTDNTPEKFSRSLKNWVFVSSAAKPDNQYAVDIDTLDKPIGFVTYWKARISPVPDKDGASVSFQRQKVMCGTPAIYLLQMLSFDSSGKLVGGFNGAENFLSTTSPDDVEVAIHNIVCSKANQKREQIDPKELQSLNSPPLRNPEIQKAIQNVLAPNKHLL